MTKMHKVLTVCAVAGLAGCGGLFDGPRIHQAQYSAAERVCEFNEDVNYFRITSEKIVWGNEKETGVSIYDTMITVVCNDGAHFYDVPVKVQVRWKK